MQTKKVTYLIYRVGKSPMQSGLVHNNTWALVPNTGKYGLEGGSYYHDRAQNTMYFTSRDALIKYCHSEGIRYTEIRDVSEKILYPKSYTDVLTGGK